jgi:FHS family L-fucose permease-like MFS transporter
MTSTGVQSYGENPTTQSPALDLAPYVYGLFFIFGGITSLNDIIAPKLKDLFSLNYTQTMLIQTAFFMAYFLVSLPAATIVRKIGYLRGAALGLVVMATGCLLFIPASKTATFSLFLAAVFVLGGGITLVQVVCNPLVAMLGDTKSASSRLTFGHAFNSIGTTIFPWVGATLILGTLAKVDAYTLTGAALDAYRTAETQVVVRAYLGLAAACAIVAAVMWSKRRVLADKPQQSVSVLSALGLLQSLRVSWGAASIFCYVGAEVAIGTIIVSYLKQSSVMGLTDQVAGQHVIYYWGGALLGRLIGAQLLKRATPGLALGGCAAMAIALLAISANTTGILAGYTLLAIGLFNSIMFPTIFALASADAGDRAEETSGVICVSIVGGALVPPMLGRIADLTGSLEIGLAVPALCYALILGFGLWTVRATHAQATLK